MSAELLLKVLPFVSLVFALMFGACLGSLVNVLVYRLPRGLDVVRPSSKCPSCNHVLTWRENIPILGWLILGGRCRFCKAKISPEYPIVEAFVALGFVAWYYVAYIMPPDAALWGVHVGAMRPDWGLNGFARTWPMYVSQVILFGCLTAMTIIDARTCTIPLVLAWVPTAVALVLHTGYGVWVEHFSKLGALRYTTPGWDWTIPTPGEHGWRWIGAAIGGGAGVILANVLLWTGLVKRSFEGYEAWEKGEYAKRGLKWPGDEASGSDGDATGSDTGATDSGTGAASQSASDDPTELWIQYPYARREMARELLFVGPIVALALAGAAIAGRMAGPWGFDHATGEVVSASIAPLWLRVVAGALLGYLVGGGVVWGTRILGSLAFGKEAMGLGDVHLMAAVGATLGWIDATLAFFGAAFVGLGWALVTSVFGSLKRAMPYGPFLAVSTVLVVLLRPAIEVGLGLLGFGGARLP
ncbi:MAG: prepilin peptidase [Phycisphaerales bacterium]|jgi:leader peptidase (prepilin peptidase)/N-methyltransferase|nr:prepilin peptidase [Phycisphaerales bacterium]